MVRILEKSTNSREAEMRRIAGTEILMQLLEPIRISKCCHRRKQKSYIYWKRQSKDVKIICEFTGSTD